MKSYNSYDTFIEKLSFEFSKIKNFHLTQEDEKGKQIFNFLMKRLTEIHSFKNLFIRYYLPAASKSVVDSLKEIKRSKYGSLIKISKEELKENYYETVRLGYIGVFHKYESYVDDLIRHAELLISNVAEEKSSLYEYVQQTFNYRIKDWKTSSTINRINWISNCNKHYDGYPLKKPKHPKYLHLSDNEKMKLTKEDLVKDIDELISHYTLILHEIFLFAMHKMVFENKAFKVDNTIDLKTGKNYIQIKKEIDEQIRKLIEL